MCTIRRKDVAAETMISLRDFSILRRPPADLFYVSTSAGVALIMGLLAAASGAAATESVTRIVSSDRQDQDQFGFSVTVHGDRLAAGSVNTTTVRNSRGGIAHVFLRGGGSWTESAVFSGSNSRTSSDYARGGMELFGERLIVGAPGSNRNGRGAAYIYERNLGGVDAWGERVYLQDPTGASFDGDRFAGAVGIDEEYAIVGSPLNDDLGFNAGKLFVYNSDHGGSDNWGLVSEIGAPGPSQTAVFGDSVAISGRLSIVGSPGDDSLVSNGGSAYIFQLNPNGPPIQRAKLVPERPLEVAEFGRNVDIWGTTAVVSAYDVETGGNVISIFEQSATNPFDWPLTSVLELDASLSRFRFDDAMALHDDLLVVGATGHPGSDVRSGAALLFKRRDSVADGWRLIETLTVRSPDYHDWPIGGSVAIYEKTIVVGAPAADFTRGEIFVFEIPEPSGATLLALATATALVRRRRRDRGRRHVRCPTAGILRNLCDHRNEPELIKP